ncbi:hypothetical protein HF521_007146 [Silurus meridionalis]|uniref:Amine oxidase domain-containing protein n=1 Tax=Silurus meridionalis TaxID=175797 RepID=A0A8T0AVZ2_SILME|nr:hypothetical protein HF521_007146 [Silurus meridionalis]
MQHDFVMLTTTNGYNPNSCLLRYTQIAREEQKQSVQQTPFAAVNHLIVSDNHLIQEVLQPRIVVVGAGAAGLGAAIKLNHLGFKNIIIVEACQQVGGRIAKANIGNAWVDTGAQYVHGASEKNPVYCLLKKSGLLSQVPEDGKILFYRCNGHKVDEDFSKYVYEAGEKIIRYYGNIGKSIGEHFAEKAQELIDMHQADEKMLVQSILSLVGKQFLLDIGASDLHNVSLASWQYYINMGEDLNVEGLMFQLVENLMEDFPKSVCS